MANCLEYTNISYDECTEYKEEVTKTCSDWRTKRKKRCKSWGWFSWLCSAFTYIAIAFCYAYSFITNILCIAYTTIVLVFCVLWEVIAYVVGVVLVLVESTVFVILDALAFVVELIFSIPFLGPILEWIFNFVIKIVNIVLSSIDIVLWWIGFRPEKKMRICTIILRDGKGEPVISVEETVRMLQMAVDIYKRDANIIISPVKYFDFSKFSGKTIVDKSWVKTDEANSPESILEQKCDFSYGFTLSGTLLRLKLSTNCFKGAFRRLIGYGSPVTCFIIRNLETGGGCSLFLASYILVDGGAGEKAISHEAGHACGLLDRCVDEEPFNLMSTKKGCSPFSNTTPQEENLHLTKNQAFWMRTSNHVTYF